MRKFSIRKHCSIPLLMAFLISGCASATKVMQEKDVRITKNYSELYFIPPKQDPREVVPKVIEEFKNMGFNVRVLDSENPITGSQGTGFLITKYHVLTCAHVVGDANAATITLAGVKYEADVVSKSKEVDIALLRLRKPALHINPVSFREGKAFRMGEEVFTIGFPLSRVLGNTARLSKGLISAAAGMKDNPDQLQISAEIQPGNSGGPLFDSQGSVLGVVQLTIDPSTMFQQTGGALPQNINFAIKSDVVLKYLKSSNKDVYDTMLRNQNTGFETTTNAVVKVRAGVIPGESGNRSSLVATLNYRSRWDLWHRFVVFAITFYDLETNERLFIAGQGRDNMVSTEELVIKDTFVHIRKMLNKKETAAVAESRASIGAWKISQSLQDGYTQLMVTRPGEDKSFRALKSPYSVSRYAISSDGRFIAYVSKENAAPELFVQQVSTGIRLAWATIKDVAGELRFKDQTITYDSEADHLVVKLGDVTTKLKEKFGSKQSLRHGLATSALSIATTPTR